MEIPSVASQLESRLIQANKQTPAQTPQSPIAGSGQQGEGKGLEVSPAAQTDKGQKIDTSA